MLYDKRNENNSKDSMTKDCVILVESMCLQLGFQGFGGDWIYKTQIFIVVMQIEVICGHPTKKLNFYAFSDQFYRILKIASFVAILTSFGQTQVLDGFQRFHWKYSKTKTKQLRDPILVPK